MSMLLLNMALFLSNGIIWIQEHGVALLGLTSFGLCLWVLYLWYILAETRYRLYAARESRRLCLVSKNKLEERLNEALKTEAKLRDHIKRNLVHASKDLRLN